MNPYIRLPKVPTVHGRQEFILARCRDKRVLHLGCVDAGLLHERFQRGELMHQELTRVASELWGIDIDSEGISFLRSKGFDNVVVGDICELDRIEELQQKSFDAIVASEVIEHLLNPGLFLDSVKALMIPGRTELIVTVPNAFRVGTLLSLLRGVEYVHPDHNYWFSYHTATNLLRKCGFDIAQVVVYSFQAAGSLKRRAKGVPANPKQRDQDETRFQPAAPHPSRQALGYLKSLLRRLVVSALYRTTAFWGDGIIIVAKIPGDAAQGTGPFVHART